MLANAQSEFVFLCIHYPLRNRHGERYGPSTRALQNAEAFENWIGHQPKIKAILHGHEHHGFKVNLETLTGKKVILNPGSSGYALDLKRQRRAHYNIYTVEDHALTHVERFAYSQASGFQPESGGAYHSKG
jgi:hypothetical protein